MTGRVVHKSNVRFYEEGKLFTFDVKDDTGEVRITAFQALVDKLYDVIKVSNWFCFRKFRKSLNIFI